jgi:hypothetical protein
MTVVSHDCREHRNRPASESLLDDSRARTKVTSLTLVCDGGHSRADVAIVPSELDAFQGERIPLRPVRRVEITTLVDNALDVFAADSGPAKR